MCAPIYEKYSHIADGYDVVAGYIANDRMYAELARFFNGTINDHRRRSTQLSFCTRPWQTVCGHHAEGLDKPFNHMQWAGAHYLMSRMEEAHSDALQFRACFDTGVLYRTGYLYRYWRIYKQELIEIHGLLQQPPNQGKIKGLSVCKMQTDSPFVGLNNLCCKCSPNFGETFQLRLGPLFASDV